MVITDRLTDSGLFPSVILLDTVSYCNLFCSMCGFRKMTRPKGYMSWELFRKIIDEVADTKPDTRVWMVFFGESLIRHDIFDMIRYTKDKGLTDVVLNSNGMLLDNIDIRAELISSGLDSIYIGIDAATRETYDKLRVGGDFKKVLWNVKRLAAESEKYGHPKVYAQFVEMEENQHEKDDFISYWSSLGVSVKIRPKVTFTGAATPFNVQNIPRYPCHWVMQTMSILWNGDVCLCANDYDGKYIFGLVTESSIKDTWALGKAVREAHGFGNWGVLPTPCRECTDWQMARAEFREVDSGKVPNIRV